MDYSSSSEFDYPALSDLSLNTFYPPERCWPPRFSVVQDDNPFMSSLSGQPQLSSCEYSKWCVPKWAALESGPFSSDVHLDPSLDPSYMLPLHDDGIFVPYLPLPELNCPSSPTDTCSTFSDMSCLTSPSPSPESIHVVCEAPLIAPVPLPYHSPTFLQFDLPDVDEDLSHPPYTQRLRSASKRKIDVYDHLIDDRASQKRRSGNVNQNSGKRKPSSTRKSKRR